jgi:hypothetical protein
MGVGGRDVDGMAFLASEEGARARNMDMDISTLNMGTSRWGLNRLGRYIDV